MASLSNLTLKQVVIDTLQRHRLLLFLLASAFLLRIWGIWNVDSTDEYNEVFEALRVCSGHLNYERWFKRFYLYILSVEYGIFYSIGWLFQQFHSPMDFAAKIIRDPEPLFLMGRITSAVFGTVSILMTYLIGNRLYSRQAGLIAALFLCFNVVNVELSHYARVDATLCAVVLISFYFIMKIFQGEDARKLRYYTLAGIFMGIAFQNKAPSIILFVPFAFAHLRAIGFKFSLGTLVNRKTASFIICFLIGLIIGNPAVLFAPLEFLKGVLATGDAFTTPINETKSDHSGYIVYLIYFYKELGFPLTFLAFYSVWKALISKSREDLLLVSFIVPFYGLMGASQYMVGYSYMIPLMPFLYILCSKYLISCLDRLKIDQSLYQKVLGFALAGLLLQPLMNVTKLLLSFSAENTRYLAKIWIEHNIPFGSKILMDSGKTINSTAPLIAQNRDSLMRNIFAIEENLEKGTLNDPTKMVDKNAGMYYRMLLETEPPESYDITSTMFGLRVETIAYYISRGYQYFIISDTMKKSRTGDYAKANMPNAARFYASLDTDKRVRLIKAITPTPMNSGETFLIYEIVDPRQSHSIAGSYSTDSGGDDVFKGDRR